MSPGAAITREILGNVPPGAEAAFYAAAFAACALAAWLLARRMLLHRRGRRARGATGGTSGADRAARGVDSSARRAGRGARTALLPALGSVLAYLTFHRELRRDRYAGIAHLLTFYGFAVLFAGTCLVFLEHQTPLEFFHGRFYLVASLVIDLGGVAFLAGLVLFLARRHGAGGGRLLRAGWTAALSWMLLAIGVTGFLLEGARIAVEAPGFERWSAAGYTVALGLRGAGVRGEAAAVLHRSLWVAHALLSVAFFALVPWGLFGHMVYGAVSWATRDREPHGKLRLPDLEREAPGAASALDLPWRDLVQADACTTCGRCNEVCPASAAGKPLRPREIVLGVRAALDAAAAARGGTAERDGGAGAWALHRHLADEALWSCTTCAACNEACPVGIEVYDKIVEARRGRIEQGEVPEIAEAVFESTAAGFNPYGRPAAERMAWALGLDARQARDGEPVRLLYWVGCAGSFDPDGRQVSRAMIKILNHLGIDYRILGAGERCTGDPARRMGEEGLFQVLARENIALLERHRVASVLTHCPHCYNTFRNEYPDLGGRFEVEHHSQFLARQIREGSLRLPSGRETEAVFHDPCYLARGNGEVEAPRRVLGALPGVRLSEMPRHGRDTFCCGAGGGAMWLDVPGATRVESIRAEEAARTGARLVATGCPFCRTMLSAAIQARGDGAGRMEVRDLAELVADAEGL